MLPNKLIRKWQNNEPTINGWLAIGNSFVAEIMVECDYDSITIDIQHGFLDYSDARGMLQALRSSAVTPIIRVPWLEPGIIMKSLDAGAYAIICPMINNKEQATKFAECMRYPPRGSRSFGPIRANISSGSDYPQHANDHVLALAMIETAEALANVDEICNTPGIDGIYIGPSDLTISITQGKLSAGFDRTEPELVEAIKTILKAAKNAGIWAGIHCGTPSYAAKAIGWGFNFTTISGDSRLMAAAATASVKEARELFSGNNNLQSSGDVDINSSNSY